MGLRTMAKKFNITCEQIEEAAATIAPSRIAEHLGVSQAFMNNLKQKNPDLHAAYRRGRDRFNGVVQTASAPYEPELRPEPTPETLPDPDAILRAIGSGCKTVKEIFNVIGGDLRLIYKQLGNLVAGGKLKKVNETFCRPEDVWEDPEQETFDSMRSRIFESFREFTYQSTGQVFHHTAIPYGVISSILDEAVESGDVVMREVGEVAVFCLSEDATDEPLYNAGNHEFKVKDEPEPSAGAAVKHNLAFAAAASGDYVAATRPDIPVTPEEDEAFDAIAASGMYVRGVITRGEDGKIKADIEPIEEQGIRNKLPETDPAEAVDHDIYKLPGEDFFRKKAAEAFVNDWDPSIYLRAREMAKKASAKNYAPGNTDHLKSAMGRTFVSPEIGQIEISPATVDAETIAQNFTYNVGLAIEAIWREQSLDSLESAITYLQRELRRRRSEG